MKQAGSLVNGILSGEGRNRNKKQVTCRRESWHETLTEAHLHVPFVTNRQTRITSLLTNPYLERPALR